jgi:ribosome modulation factor
MTTTDYMRGYRAAMRDIVGRAMADVPLPEDQSARGLEGWRAARGDAQQHLAALADPILTTFEDDDA